MKRTKTSKAWMKEHVNDPFVQQAKAEGFRSRAAFKLTEIDHKDQLIRKGDVVVDLGAAPGSWSQVALRAVGQSGRVFALDLLEMAPLTGVDFIQGDFCEDTVLQALEARLEGREVNVVLSDMAPNISGIDMADQARSVQLAELALEFAQAHLSDNGCMVVKVFQGQGFMEYRQQLQRVFRRLNVRKPKASRDRSSEVYLVGSGFKGTS